MTPILIRIWFSAPSRPISGNVQATALIRKLERNGASATMNSPIWVAVFSILKVRK